MLPGPHGGWLDGGEQRIAAIVRGAADLSSTSDELAAHRDDWIERYHLSRERANVVRCLDIPDDCAVLEIGAGCGAVTRYLGEVAGAVDALEPTPERAAVARARTHDLANVELFVGELDALPAEPAYDLVVIIGVLEYVGGAAGPEPRIEFLREAAARLKPGGAVVCAIENQLGVKYLAGAPEDHAGAPFEGIEDYPRRGPYRTFSRRALERMVGAAGLSPDVYHAFPDYKLPRLIYSDALLEGDAAPLAWRAARFPSPDDPVPRPRLANEGRLWRSAVKAGLGGELANSFVVVGRKDDASPWPDDQLAIFWSSGRRTRFSTVSRLVADDGVPARLERTYLRELDGPRGEDGLEHHCIGSRYLTAAPLSEVLEEVEDDRLGAWLQRWRRHAEQAATSNGARTHIDVGPQNVIVDGEALKTIDEEWSHSGYSADDAIDRTLLHLTFALAEGRAPASWPQRCETVRDLLDEIYARAGSSAPSEQRAAGRRAARGRAAGADQGCRSARPGVARRGGPPCRRGPAVPGQAVERDRARSARAGRARRADRKRARPRRRAARQRAGAEEGRDRAPKGRSGAVRAQGALRRALRQARSRHPVAELAYRGGGAAQDC